MTMRGIIAAHHSMPCCARMPASIGCLTFTTSDDEVGGRDQLGRRVAAGDHDVLEARAVAQRRDHVVELDPAPLDRVGDLVEQQELVALLGDHPLDARPALARLVGRLLEILRDPRPAVAHLLPVDAAERRRGLRLADLPLARLDELEDAAAVAARPGAQEHAEGRRALALAVAGEDDDAAAGRGACGAAARRCPASPGRCGTSTSSPPWRMSCSGIVLGHAAVLGIAGGR